MAGAMELLRRLTRVVGQPFENLEAAASLLIRKGHHAEAVEFLAEQVKAAPWDASARLRLVQEQIATGSDTASAKTTATAIAADRTVLYRDRSEAATLLGATQSKLGSAELDQLAKGTTIGPASADVPYFYAARVRSAEKASALAVREQLLRNALNDMPERDTARLPLFHTLIAAGREQEAISAMEPLLRSSFLSQTRNAYRGEEAYESDETSNTETESNADAKEEPFHSTGAAFERATASERAVLAAEVGRAYVKLEELQTALRYFTLARNLDGSKAARAGFEKSIAGVRSAMRRRSNNALRQPMVRRGTRSATYGASSNSCSRKHSQVTVTSARK